MTRNEIEENYTIEDGIIQDPGRFEAEPVYVPYFVDALMNGDPGEFDETSNLYELRDFDPECRQEFPELKPFRTITIWQSDQGFWFHSLD